MMIYQECKFEFIHHEMSLKVFCHNEFFHGVCVSPSADIVFGQKRFLSSCISHKVKYKVHLRYFLAKGFRYVEKGAKID